MDFNLDETQQEIADLARRILEDRVDHQRLKTIEAGDEWFDRETWAELAKAGLVGIALAEDVGGGGMGMVELGQVLEAQGRTVAPLPLVPTMTAALAIDAYGSPEQRQAYLPGVADGSIVLTAALQEYLNDDVRSPYATATRSNDGSWTVTGVKVMVEFLEQAHRVLLAARTDDGVAVFLVDPKASGITIERIDTTTGIPEARITFDGAPVLGVLGAEGAGADIVRWIELRATAGLAATAVGVCDAALRITAEYTKTREQFGRPIATFQAVSQRAGDAYIDTEAVRLTALQAAWRISAGLPAETEVAIAKFWAADGGQRVVHAAQHLHGGIGVDRDYPVHRYFLWAKSIELTLGGATQQLLKIGKALADRQV